MRKLVVLLLIPALAATTFAVKDLLSDQKRDQKQKMIPESAPPLSSADFQRAQPAAPTDTELAKAAAMAASSQPATVKPTPPPLGIPASPPTPRHTPDPLPDYYSNAEAEALALKAAGRPIPAALYDRITKHYGLDCQPDRDRERQGGDTIEEAAEVVLDETYEGTTVGYSNDYDEICPFSGSTAADVVYLLTLTEETGFNLDLCDSGYDTKVYVYDEGLNLIDCNDDACPGFRSELLIELVPAGDYYIVIDGYGSSEGDYILHITEFVCDPLECEGTDEIEDNGGCNAVDPSQVPNLVYFRSRMICEVG